MCTRTAFVTIRQKVYVFKHENIYDNMQNEDELLRICCACIELSHFLTHFLVNCTTDSIIYGC